MFTIKGISSRFELLFCLVIVFQLNLSGCATTDIGKGFELLDQNEYAKALPYFEKAAKENHVKLSALIASLIYLSDYQIPRDINKSRDYYQLAQSMAYDRYDQSLDYFLPLANARIILYDSMDDNDPEAIRILRRDKYAKYPPSLGLLAKSCAFGKGIRKKKSPRQTSV